MKMISAMFLTLAHMLEVSIDLSHGAENGALFGGDQWFAFLR